MMKNAAERLILAGDIGGTNTNLALVRFYQGKFDIHFSMRFSTQEEKSLIDPMRRFLEHARNEGFLAPIEVCCISAAGPVSNGSIQLTNAPWAINAAEITDRFHFSVHLINDFTAISYAVVLLDLDDEKQIAWIPHTDGSKPRPLKGMALVVGAGTGLGVGFIDKKEDESYLAYPSEGGHSSMPCWDSLSLSFFRWLEEKSGMEPGIELAVSGQGINNIFTYLCSESFDPAEACSYALSCGPINTLAGSLAADIFSRPESERPALISSNRTKDPRCCLAMELFVEFYARKVSSLSSIFLPSGGVYLAGGISSKNEAFLMENNRFMRIFERNYATHIKDFLAKVPVMIVRNYSISLIGAANAAVQLGR